MSVLAARPLTAMAVSALFAIGAPLATQEPSQVVSLSRRLGEAAGVLLSILIAPLAASAR